jgi:hypothetical protein
VLEHTNERMTKETAPRYLAALYKCGTKRRCQQMQTCRKGAMYLQPGSTKRSREISKGLLKDSGLPISECPPATLVVETVLILRLSLTSTTLALTWGHWGGCSKEGSHAGLRRPGWRRVYGATWKGASGRDDFLRARRMAVWGI